MMHDTIWEGKVQSLVFPPDHPKYPGLPKGARQIAVERGLDHTVKKKYLVAQIAECEDFKNETCELIVKLVESYGFVCLFIPKFHCEFNPAELVWASSKAFCRHNCTYNIPGLEKNIPASLQAINAETYRRMYQHALEEIAVAAEGTPRDKMKLKMYKSHRPPVGALPWKHLIE